MFAALPTGKDTLSNVIVKIEKMRLSRMSCCAQHILQWYSFTVLNRFCFKSREEGAGGNIPLKLPLLNPLCQCYIYNFQFFLCRTLWCLWRSQHTARRQLGESECGRPWLLPHVQSQRGAADPERPRRRGGPISGQRPWHPLHSVWTGGPELTVCGPRPPWAADCAGWQSSSRSPSKREASSVTTPAHTHRKHTPLWFNVFFSGDWKLFCANERIFLVCVSFFMWKAADPRHYFNQGRRGYWWRHGRCW